MPSLKNRIRGALAVLKSNGKNDFFPVNGRFLSFGFLPGSERNWHADVGEGFDSNVFLAPMFWYWRNATEGEIVVERNDAGRWVQVPDHPLARLLNRPNPFYEGDTLIKATLASYLGDGNGYWMKVRDSFGEVVQLWYAPHTSIDPVHETPESFIDYYSFLPQLGGFARRIEVENVVHLRFGLDPKDIRFGLGPVRSLLREIATDEFASNYTANLLRNMGVPGMVVTPKDPTALPDPDEVEKLKKYLGENFGGDASGKPLVLGTPTDVHQYAFNPQQLLLNNVRDLSEERCSAILGLNAAVVGLGAGLSQVKVGATMEELRRSAWNNALIPTMNTIARQIGAQLLPDFQSQANRFRLRFDASGASANAEDEAAKAERIGKLFERRIIDLEHAQTMLAIEPHAVAAPERPAPGTVPTEGGEDGTDND